jgi:hypothetical protein
MAISQLAACIRLTSFSLYYWGDDLPIYQAEDTSSFGLRTSIGGEWSVSVLSVMVSFGEFLVSAQ